MVPLIESVPDFIFQPVVATFF